jgi:phosphoribosyl-ATP pyrophosphohydrolase
MSGTLKRLENTIKERRVGDPALSYVAKLTAAGRAKMAQKLGEEAVETVIAAIGGDAKAVIDEAADLMFHLGVLLADMDLSFDDVMAELDRREGISGIDEKASRKAE